MRHIDLNGCSIDIIPIVNGLVSEAERIRPLIGDYEAYGATVGIEGIQAIRNRANIDDEYDVSELDLVYAQHMGRFGTVEMPSPALCAFVDACTEKGKHVIALDMNDYDFTDMYCKTVKTGDFVKEHRLAKKGLKRKFEFKDPESFAIEWDEYVNTVNSYKKLSEKREEHIVKQIKDVTKYRKSLLMIIEIERLEGVMRLLEDGL